MGYTKPAHIGHTLLSTIYQKEFLLRPRLLSLALVAGLTAAVLPAPAFARGAPETLATQRALGDVDGRGAVEVVDFPIQFLGISWTGGQEPKVRFRVAESWTRWQTAHEDDMPQVGGRTFSGLVAAPGGADAYQVAGNIEDARAVAINTSDGARSWHVVTPEAQASHLAQPGLVTRAQWGADESLRFNADGTEKWTPAFYPTQKLVVHHTATQNDDSDPAATVRAIYRYHAIDKGWGDIGYNFLVDGNGTTYKGRYSGPAGTLSSDSATGENADSHGVTAAHVSGYNSGTMGIAVLGTYTSRSLPATARNAIVDHLSWESERHSLDPLSSSTYTNPVNGATKESPNISGHRDWGATECPGDLFYSDLGAIRSDVAARVGGTGSTPDSEAPSAPTSLTAGTGKRRITLSWTASVDSGGSGLAGYEVWRATSVSGTFSKVATTTDTTYVNTGLARGKTYWYYVVAYDSAGNRSAASNTASAKAG